MITCLIIDDEPYAHEVLKNHIAQNESLRLLKHCYHVREAKEYLAENTVDLIFLDINMPDITGLEWLKEEKVNANIVLCTAYSEHALEAFDLNIIDYLLKPIALNRFEKAIQKVNKMIMADKQTPTIKLKIGYNVLSFLYTDIQYFQSVGNFVKIVCTSKSHLCLITMHELEAKLDDNYFIRIHKSYIASVESIRQSMSLHKVVINNVELPIGRTYNEVVKGVLKK